MLCYRRKLPHWVPDDSIIFVTWRLAGSDPPSRPETLTAGNTGRITFALNDKALGSANTGPFWLRDPRVAGKVEDAIRFGEAVRGFYFLYAWPLCLITFTLL